LRLVAILAAVPFHAFLGVVLLTASSPLAPDAYPSLNDQRDAAGVLWATGELLSLALVAVVVRQWWRADSREAGRSDRRQNDRAARWADRPIDAP
jgi:putative copper resistance protein D